MTATGKIEVSLSALSGPIERHLEGLYLLDIVRCHKAGEITTAAARILAARVLGDWQEIEDLFPWPHDVAHVS